MYRVFMKRYFANFFPEEAENFLCFTTRFEEDERISIDQACNHLFLAGFDQGAFLRNNSDSLASLFRCFLFNDSLEISKVLLNTILKNMCNYYAAGERWFELDENFEGEESGAHKFVIEKSDHLMQYLSYEFGVPTEHLWRRLQQIKKASYKYVEDD